MPYILFVLFHHHTLCYHIFNSFIQHRARFGIVVNLVYFFLLSLINWLIDCLMIETLFSNKECNVYMFTVPTNWVNIPYIGVPIKENQRQKLMGFSYIKGCDLRENSEVKWREEERVSRECLWTATWPSEPQCQKLYHSKQCALGRTGENLSTRFCCYYSKFCLMGYQFPLSLYSGWT